MYYVFLNKLLFVDRKIDVNHLVKLKRLIIMNIYGLLNIKYLVNRFNLNYNRIKILSNF